MHRNTTTQTTGPEPLATILVRGIADLGERVEASPSDTVKPPDFRRRLEAVRILEGAVL